jgi:hypothetical protein
MSERIFRIVISSRSNGILVERQEWFGREIWKTIDRYNTHDLTAELKRTDPWIAAVVELCSQPTAGVEIVMPPMPVIQPTILERLETFSRREREKEMQAQHDAEFRAVKEASIFEREKPLAATLLDITRTI